MSHTHIPHFAAKRDSNEKQIIRALMDIGAAVCKLSVPGMADLVVGFRGQTYLLEVKSRKGKLTPMQVETRDQWGEYIQIARTVEDAFRIIGAIS